MKRATNRKGFTLVELLIVIVVIGILSAMMMLSSTEAVTSANASNIISNLRNLKTAALAYYVDNLDYLEADANKLTTDAENKTVLNLGDGTGTKPKKGICAYLNGTSVTVNTDANTFDSSGFTFGISAIKRTNGGSLLSDAKWYVYCTVPDVKVQQKLQGRAKSVGLLPSALPGDDTTNFTAGDSGSTTVYYLVR